jgi:hypothetical protein
VVCFAPRAPGDSVRPRRSSGASVRPLNFTVRFSVRPFYLSLMLALAIPALCRGGDLVCPKGTTPKAESTPQVSEAWCEILRAGATEMHGPYRAWWPNGKLGTEGQYSHEKQTGRWRGWYETGELQGEEWYEDGRRVKGHYFDKAGHEIPEPKT